ncbi:CBS domain-containing protein [Echinicola vietnamensis]|uniref:Putative transcriptional regulator, contains C-terminal CBS domains n=1 Tax=Echinicola vietnamensis (strain DSM 17526 / LMG 23754 / KMM 6221) TaxID=926556 RepID=L0G5Z3_ECHVK|nr:CBS domain-containing protein [Echinicola vietnamensis]AGA80260.1 putative transcriptional regulator, contains C-terminal CBS domains [Echinicola vietnamensis DSM 17526]
MVKSFQGVRMAEPQTRASQPILVSNHMTTNLTTFHPDDTIDHVVQVLTQKRISGAPVLDDGQNLVGIISEVDCLKEIIRGKYNNTPRMAGRVREHMTKDVVTMDPEVTIFDAAHRFLELKIRRFPVLKDGKLLGQISLSDIIRAMPRLKSETW